MPWGVPGCHLAAVHIELRELVPRFAVGVNETGIDHKRVTFQHPRISGYGHVGTQGLDPTVSNHERDAVGPATIRRHHGHALQGVRRRRRGIVELAGRVARS